MSALHRLSLYLPPILLAAALFISSSRPMPQPMEDIGLSDKSLHLMAYAVFAFLVARAIYARGISRSRTVTIAVLICGLYGVSDEIHQAFVPSRTPDVLDAWFDLAGSLLGTAAWIAAARWQRRLSRE